MKYWLTTHWPPLVDLPVPLGVWLEDGKEHASKGMKAGDLLLVYQTASGPSLRVTNADHTSRVVHRTSGRQGVVMLAEILSAPCEQEVCGIERYSDNTQRWWRYLANAKAINSVGYVPRSEAATALGYSKDYVFRGIGTARSGLMELCDWQFKELSEAFIASHDQLDAQTRENVQRRSACGPGGEGPAHLALKIVISKDPSAVLGESGLTLWQMEYLLPTGDRVDLVLTDRYGRFVVVEVEVECAATEEVGPLQCMKYRALISYLHKRNINEIRAILVAHSIHPLLQQECASFDIECIQIGN